jgi:hypothetical protein
MPGSPLLPTIEIAEPCSNSWDSMSGDDRVRHCTDCNLDVYNSIGLREDELFALVSEREGRLCMRLYKRPDGSVLTRDCREARILGFRDRLRQLCPDLTLHHVAYVCLLGLLVWGLGPLGLGLWVLCAHIYARRAHISTIRFVVSVWSMSAGLGAIYISAMAGLAVIALTCLPLLVLFFPELFTAGDAPLGEIDIGL